MAEVQRDALEPFGFTLPAVTPISGPSAQLNLFSFITPIDLNRLLGASVLKSRRGAHYALSAKKLDSAELPNTIGLSRRGESVTGGALGWLYAPNKGTLGAYPIERAGQRSGDGWANSGLHGGG